MSSRGGGRLALGAERDMPVEADERARVGRVFDVQRFSIHDGPGIRTTVFLKGCPLRCVWCHNPEGMRPDMELSFAGEKCIGCGYCFRACPNGCHVDAGGRHVLLRGRCAACGRCTEECFAQALECVGREMRVDEVMHEVLRDCPFYETSGGGLTVSGGEPLMQFDFAASLLRSARRAHVHTCLETCGYAPAEKVERISEWVDLFLYDFKETDPRKHREFTGVSNDRILDNLRLLHARGARIVLRCPLVPGLNDRPDHFDGIAELSRELPGMDGVELMPYHALGKSKLDRLGHGAVPDCGGSGVEPETVREWVAALGDRGLTVLNEV